MGKFAELLKHIVPAEERIENLLYSVLRKYQYKPSDSELDWSGCKWRRGPCTDSGYYGFRLHEISAEQLFYPKWRHQIIIGAYGHATFVGSGLEELEEHLNEIHGPPPAGVLDLWRQNINELEFWRHYKVKKINGVDTLVEIN